MLLHQLYRTASFIAYKAEEHVLLAVERQAGSMVIVHKTTSFMFRHGNAQRPRHILYQKSVQFSYYIIRNCHNMETNLVIVVKCFQSEQSSGQSLQFPHPTHQNFNFISVSGCFGRIFCLFFMARIQFPPTCGTKLMNCPVKTYLNSR